MTMSVKRVFRYNEAADSVVEYTDGANSARLPAWPIECIASGVAPQQAGELRQFFAKHGESVDVTADGNPIYTSHSQRKRLLKLRNLYDKAAYC